MFPLNLKLVFVASKNADVFCPPNLRKLRIFSGILGAILQIIMFIPAIRVVRFNWPFVSRAHALF